jgi:hypothetical protein
MKNLWKRTRAIALAAVPAGLLLLPGCQPDDVAMFLQDFARTALAAYLF